MGAILGLDIRHCSPEKGIRAFDIDPFDIAFTSQRPGRTPSAGQDRNDAHGSQHRRLPHV